jgi:hypothetical protein
MSIARQNLSKHVSMATNTHAIIEELLKAVFSMQSMPIPYNEDQQDNQMSHESAGG